MSQRVRLPYRSGSEPNAHGPVPPPPRPDARLTVVLGFAIAISTVAAYWGVQSFDFVDYDDTIYVIQEPHVNGGITRAGVAWALTRYHDATWHPLTSLSHMLDCELFGLDPGPHHVHNVLLHLCNAELLFVALLLGTRFPVRSAVVAALFAVHPLHVESVAWVSERKDVLSTFFLMATMSAYGWYTRSPNTVRYGATLLLLVCGLLSKPMLVTVPFVLLLLDVWPLRRWDFADGRAATRPWAVAIWLPLVKEKLPLLAAAACAAAVTLLTQRSRGAVGALEVYGIGLRVANAIASYGRYVIKTIWPADLSVFYVYRDTVPAALVAGTLAAAAVVTWLATRWRSSRPYLLVGWLWYLVTLLPVIGIIQVGSQSHADRYTYVPHIGLFVAVVWLIAEWAAKETGRARRWVAGAAAAGVVIALTASTRAQLQHWRDSESLFRRAVDVEPFNVVARYNYGNALMDLGRFDEAVQQFVAVTRIEPKHWEAWNNMALSLARLGRYDEASVALGRAVALRPQSVELRHTLMRLSLTCGRPADAERYAREALAIDDASPASHLELGKVLAILGRDDEAFSHVSRAATTDPGNVTAQIWLAERAERHGQWAEARTRYSAAAALRPADPVPHARLTRVAVRMGDNEAADRCAAEFARRNSDPVAANNLAWTLATSPDAGERSGSLAVSVARHAAACSPSDRPDVLDTLAAAYAEAGRFQDAVATAHEAVVLAEKAGQAELAKQIRDRLALYERGQPYREPAPATKASG